MLLTLMSLAAFAPQGPGPSLAPVVINEFSYDDVTGTDDKEFVELYNRTNAVVDLSGWTIQCVEGTLATTPPAINFTFTFPSGIFINPGQYVVVGTALVPNLTPGITPPAANWLENSQDADGLLLSDSLSNPIDSVLWCFAKWTNPIPTYLEGSGLNGRTFAQDSATNPNFWTMQRRIDGWDSNNNGADFVNLMWTPGGVNGTGNNLPLGAQILFDGAPASTLTAEFSSSFTPPVVADPTLVSNSTTTTIAIPASPQGGNVGVLHDRTGGGNAHAYRSPVGEDFLVETWVYVFGGNAALPGTEGESWAIGVGTTDPYASPVDVPTTYYATTSACTGVGNREPGATGVAWMAYQTTTQTVIYLVDMNDGGPGYTVLGGPIVATPGVNDGWQRLRIRVRGTDLVANFGGTYAVDDGTRFTATLPSRVAGQAYFQFRECVLANGNIKPLIVDRVEIYGTTSFGFVVAGTGSPSSNGIPTIASIGGDPIVGNLAWGCSSSNWAPFTAGGLVVTVGPVIPGGIQIPGAQPGALLYAPLPETLLFIAIADGVGNVAQPVGIPADNAFVGVQAALQFANLDPSIAFPLQFATSPGAQLTVGN